MWKICRYEFYKIYRKKIFWLLTAVLFAGNLLTFYTYEKNTAEYYYIAEYKDRYEDFWNGSGEDRDGFYERDQEKQIQYVQSYQIFIQEMSQRAEKMVETSIFDNPDSFVYRNIQKTCRDYKKFTDIELKPDNCYGVQALAGYEEGILFLLIFLGILIYYVVLYEQDQKLLLLLKVNRRGRTPVVVSKILVTGVFAAGYGSIQAGSNVFLADWLYGYGDVERPLQSVSLFRNCASMITVSDYLWMTIVCNVLTAVFLGILLLFLGTLCKNGLTAGMAVLTVLGAEFLCRWLISRSSAWYGWSCVNVLYCWNAKNVLGDYFNLNIGGYPVGKTTCILVISLLMAVLFMIGTIYSFNRTCQLRRESRLENVWKHIRSKMYHFPKTTSLLFYEGYKVVIQQKKGVILLFLLVWGIGEIQSACGESVYSDADTASYHSYMKKLQGTITDETVAFIAETEIYFEEIMAEYQKIADVTYGKDYVRKLELESELKMNEGGFQMVAHQFHQLEEMPGSLYDKYLIDEKSYINLWTDVKTDIKLWVIGCIAIILMAGGIYPMDVRRQMNGLLAATVNGRSRLRRRKNQCGIAGAVILFVITELPLLIRYYRIDSFTASPQHMSDITVMNTTTELTVTAFIILVFWLKFLSMMLVCFAVLTVSLIIKNEIITDVILIGVLIIIAVLLNYFQTDIVMLLIRML